MPPERLSWWKCKAATPATWAAATEVTDLVVVAERDSLFSTSTCWLETTDVPGARMSTQLLTLERVGVVCGAHSDVGRMGTGSFV
jgi:hypothetical protein